jgi:signal transduction histidine kinase
MEHVRSTYGIDQTGDNPVIAKDVGDFEHCDPASSGLIAHIQNSTEDEKAVLARELHDELGGLLVGAMMDLAWAEQHLSAPPAELKQKLIRARQTLSAAIDLKRKLIEDLRPTLLDNVGLFAALRWHVQAMCKRAGVACTIHLPEDERRFFPSIPIGLFRIVQEAFAIMVVRRHVASADFSLTIGQQLLTIRILTDAAPSLPKMGALADPHSLAAIEHRTATLGGEFEYIRLPAGGTSITALFPIESTLSPV